MARQAAAARAKGRMLPPGGGKTLIMQAASAAIAPQGEIIGFQAEVFRIAIPMKGATTARQEVSVRHVLSMPTAHNVLSIQIALVEKAVRNAQHTAVG